MHTNANAESSKVTNSSKWAIENPRTFHGNSGSPHHRGTTDPQFDRNTQNVHLPKTNSNLPLNQKQQHYGQNTWAHCNYAQRGQIGPGDSYRLQRGNFYGQKN